MNDCMSTQGTLSFSKNGVDFGIAYSSGLLGKELYPAVSLYDVWDKVTIRDNVEEKANVTANIRQVQFNISI
jgi:hypothetical protein